MVSRCCLSCIIICFDRCIREFPVEVLNRAVVHIEVDMFLVAVISCKSALVAVLPEFPVHKVRLEADASYPQGIVGEAAPHISEIDGASCVYDRLYAIKLFNDDKPLTNSLLQLANRQIARLLDIKHGRQVARLEMHLVQEEPRLAFGTAIGREEMVHATHEIVLAGLIEILVGSSAR